MEPRGNVGVKRRDKILQMISRGRQTLVGLLSRNSHTWRRKGFKCAKQMLPGKKKSNLKVENYALFGGFLRISSPEDSFSDCSEELLPRGRGVAKIYRSSQTSID